MYIKIINNKPENYSIEQLRRENPETSFPDHPSDQLLAQWGLYSVKQLPRPSYNSETHYLKQSEFYQLDGNWQVHFGVEPLPRAQVEEAMRSKRNRLLSESDWVVSCAYEEQNPVPDPWKDYRQKLRDITTQQGFPFDLIWPTKPEK